jgi:hypothetical protein
MALAIKHSMKFQVVMMTPSWASKLLTLVHPNQRRPKEGRIQGYGRNMRGGQWDLTPYPVCQDEDGYITDGVNRLNACVRFNVDFPCVFVTGCPRRAIYGTDIGAPRSVTDIMRISGERLPKGANVYIGAVRRMRAGLTRERITPREVIEYGKRHASALDWAFELLPRNTRRLALSSLRAVIARAYYDTRFRDRTREFAEVLESGLPRYKSADESAVRLRNWLIQHAGVPDAVEAYARTEYALQRFHMKLETPQLLATRDELFPLEDDDVEIL